MKDCSVSREFPALTHDGLADSVIERPLTETTINRIAEAVEHYEPNSWRSIKKQQTETDRILSRIRRKT